MDAIGGDLFATKGLEYVLVIGYLLLLVGCRRMVGPRRVQAIKDEAGQGLLDSLSFQLRDGIHYHQGHAWAATHGDGIMRVGIDDFAQKLVGPVTGLILPRIGTELGEGEPGWKLRMGRRAVPVLSPVEGEVVGWNDEVLRSPELMNNQPYDGGWLMEVRVRNLAAALRNLLSGNLAHAWLDGSAAKIAEMLLDQQEATSAETISTRPGLAQRVAPDSWDRLAAEFLLTQDESDWSPYPAAAGQGQEAQLA